MNRRIPADDVMTMMMILTITMMMDIIEEDKMSGMRHIDIVNQADDAETQVKKAVTEEEHDDLENRVTLLRESTTHVTARGQVPHTDNNSRRPAHIGPTPELTRQGNLPTTTLDITNRIATSSNTTPADNTTRQHITNNTINIHM